MEKQFCTCGYKTDWYDGHKDRQPCPKCRRAMYRLIDKDDNLIEDPSLKEVEKEIEEFNATLDLAKKVAILEEQIIDLKNSLERHIKGSY